MEVFLKMISTTPMIVLYGIIPYLIGSIPFGLILTKIFIKQDLTKIGSGNIGATNVLRTGNKILAATTLFLDIGKGVLAVFLVNTLKYYDIRFAFTSFHADALTMHNTFIFLSGLFAILGHCFPIWLKFKGGKGVATTFGVLLAAVPVTGVIAALTWLISAFTVRISSLAAISAMLVAPAVTYTMYGLYPALVNGLISIFVIWRHKDNIKRLRAGTEPRIGAGK